MDQEENLLSSLPSMSPCNLMEDDDFETPFPTKSVPYPTKSIPYPSTFNQFKDPKIAAKPSTMLAGHPKMAFQNSHQDADELEMGELSQADLDEIGKVSVVPSSSNEEFPMNFNVEDHSQMPRSNRSF